MSDFTCLRCGNCCRPRGVVRLKEDEIPVIAGWLGVPETDFTGRFTRLTDDRLGLSLNEDSDGSCIFLGAQGSCIIQEVKPRQCRDFPVKWRFDGYEEICEAEKRRRSVVDSGDGFGKGKK